MHSYIQTPQDLRTLPLPSLSKLAKELRQELINVIPEIGGHFSSNLGVVELSIALHYAFQTPKDKLIWDVGHQAYVHKMLTHRRSLLPTIRQEGGISGFLKPQESPYDTFGAGHAGTSLSAALGMRLAEDTLHGIEKQNYVLPIIGDGSLTCGMALEALNHIGALRPKNFIVVLNDNGMSISENIGAIHRICSEQSIDSRAPNQDCARTVEAYFTSLGFTYLGPVDGHSLKDLLQTFELAKFEIHPVLVHVKTTKGKGHPEAERASGKWHGIAAPSATHDKQSPSTYTEVFGNTLVELAKRDKRIVAITAAMPSGTGLERFQRELPNAFYDVGICEQHAVTLAAGMASQGLRPVCAIYSTFLQRAVDQIIHDVCIQNLPVIFAVDRAGVVGNDGETHQGLFDIALLRTCPNLVIMSPKDDLELQSMLSGAFLSSGPVVIRYPRGKVKHFGHSSSGSIIPYGRAEILERGEAGALIALGPLVGRALEVASTLRTQYDLPFTVINARYAKPLDSELFARELPNYSTVCILEDHALSGGFSSALLESLNDSGVLLRSPAIRLGARDCFYPHTTQERQHESSGLSHDQMVEMLVKACKNNSLERVSATKHPYYLNGLLS